jgi:cytochrome c553
MRASPSIRLTTALLVIAAMASACEGKPATTPNPTPTPTPSVGTTAPAKPGLTEIDRVALMEQHYMAVIEAHDSVIAGDHATAKARLTTLAAQDLPPQAPEAWKALHQAMQKAASAGESAHDVPSAASAVAGVVQTCGQCHSELGRAPFQHKPPTPAPSDVVADKMQSHQWATERLWEGVAGPADPAWQRGAAALSESRVFPADREGVAAEVLEQEAALRTLGGRALETAPADRAALYGELLATCAGCHAQIGVKVKRKGQD